MFISFARFDGLLQWLSPPGGMELRQGRTINSMSLMDFCFVPFFPAISILPRARWQPDYITFRLLGGRSEAAAR